MAGVQFHRQTSTCCPGLFDSDFESLAIGSWISFRVQRELFLTTYLDRTMLTTLRDIPCQKWSWKGTLISGQVMQIISFLMFNSRSLDGEELEGLRVACRLGREVSYLQHAVSGHEDIQWMKGGQFVLNICIYSKGFGRSGSCSCRRCYNWRDW